MSKSTLLLMLGGALVGCDVLDPPSCTTQAVPGVTAEVVDSLSGAPVTDRLVGYVTDGAYVEQLTPMGATGSSRLAGAYERPGDYTLRITAEGYMPWEEADLRVAKGTCHVKSVSVEVRMVPSSTPE